MKQCGARSPRLWKENSFCCRLARKPDSTIRTTKKPRRSVKNEPDERQRISGELKAAEQEQRQIIQQISDRAAEGRPRLAALDIYSTTLRSAWPGSKRA